MSTFFWILGILVTAGLTFAVTYFVIRDQLCIELLNQRKQLGRERQNFKKSHDEAQDWYSQALKSAHEKGTELNRKEKELQELKVQLEMQIAKNNQDKEKFIEAGRAQLKDYELYIKNLESRLESARQRSKRFAKQAKNQV
jgi:hypothetical protein